MAKQKQIAIDEDTHEIIRLESLRQSYKDGKTVTMGDVIADFAGQVNNEFKHLEKPNTD